MYKSYGSMAWELSLGRAKIWLSQPVKRDNKNKPLLTPHDYFMNHLHSGKENTERELIKN